MRTNSSILFAAVAFLSSGLVACATQDATGDGENDTFLSGGKADEDIAEDSPEARGVLQVANTYGRRGLDDTVGLDARAADHIMAYRAGDDGEPNTDDDQRFRTLAELDAVPWVGPVALGKLLDEARSRGYVEVDACVLGNDYNDMLQAYWLDVGAEVDVTPDDAGGIAHYGYQFRAGLRGDFLDEHLPSIAEAFAQTDGNMFQVREVVERATGRTFRVFFFIGADGDGRGFVDEDTSTDAIADIAEDGYFGGCTVARGRW